MAEAVVKKRMAKEISDLKNELNWKTVLAKFLKMFSEHSFTPSPEPWKGLWDYEWLRQVKKEIELQDLEGVHLVLSRINETYIFEFVYTAFQSCPELYEELKNEYDLQEEVVEKANELYGTKYEMYHELLDSKPLALRERVKEIRCEIIKKKGASP